jgi:hypothetical protein
VAQQKTSTRWREGGDNLISQLTLPELAPFRSMQNSKGKMQKFCILHFYFYIIAGVAGASSGRSLSSSG